MRGQQADPSPERAESTEDSAYMADGAAHTCGVAANPDRQNRNLVGFGDSWYGHGAPPSKFEAGGLHRNTAARDRQGHRNAG